MNQHEKLLAVLFAILSAFFSFGCLFYGVGVFTNPSAPQWMKVFAYAVAGYGMANVYILSTAWRSKAGWCAGANKVAGICLFGVLVMDRVSTGIHGTMEVAGLCGVALMLWINWQAVKKAVQRTDEESVTSRPNRKKGKRRSRS